MAVFRSFVRAVALFASFSALSVFAQQSAAPAQDSPCAMPVFEAGKAGKKDSYLIQAFDASNGKQLGSVLVDSGNLSFKVRSAITVGDTVFVYDSNHRTLVYSLKTGEQRGKVQGRILATSATGDRMLIAADRSVGELYDTTSMERLSRYVFPNRISDADFMQDGRLMVLTSDQAVYQFKSASEARVTSTETPK